MEVQNAEEHENEETLEASVIENDTDVGKDVELVVEAEKDESDAVETSTGGKSKEDEDFVENLMDAKPDEAGVNVLVEEVKETENGTVEETSVLTSVEASSSGMKKAQGLLAKKKIAKKVKKLVKKQSLKGTAVQVAGEENVTVKQGINKDEQSAEPSLGESEKKKKVMESVVDSSGKDKDSETPLGGNVMEAEKAIEGSVEAPENVLSVKKKQPRRLRGKAKLRKTQAALLITTEVDKGTSEGGQQKNFAKENKQNQLTEEKTAPGAGNRRRKKRQGEQVLGSNKKHQKDEVTAADVPQQRMEERKEELITTDKKEMDGHGKAKIGGLIFMCNAKTRPDCFRFSVMGVQEKRKDYVMGIKPGLKLFLYDYDLKLLYGIFQASSAGGMKLERNAFGGSFPAQVTLCLTHVRFKVVSDCIPLPESQFKKAIKENYNNKNKFKTELTHKQVFKLKKLFRPATLPAQLTHTLPIPVPRDADRKRSENDRYAPSSSRANLTHRHERSCNAAPSPPTPRREPPPHDLYLSEREYRTYGLRRGETSEHYPIPPPDSFYHNVNRDRVPLDSYHPSVDRDRLLRHAEMERHDRREVRVLHLPERDYHPYDHLSSRREILARNSPDPPASAVALDSYRRDPYYSYEYRAPERAPRAYMVSPRREDDDLYSRYVTADSLADYYRSSRRYPSIAVPELPPSSVISRYAYSGSLPYSHR
ncbi:unnamed protein product [Arabis nemorensis]|uniref:DCD domain-containing protein n=1 Tax=Arabis nemorensis TaxID=586526 RepID=A0A565CBF2_9BRAS|nr:unnamed protein product [Arabis nemorensis]